jgi:hypothetical protein
LCHPLDRIRSFSMTDSEQLRSQRKTRRLMCDASIPIGRRSFGPALLAMTRMPSLASSM